MPFVDPWTSHSPIEWERRMYEQTGNTLHVWRAIQICSELMLPKGTRPIIDCYPDWVCNYLSVVADRFEELYNAPDGEVKNFGPVVADCLGMKKLGQGVRSDAYEIWERARRDRMLAVAVWRYLKLNPGASVRDACGFLAEESAERARRFETAKREGRFRPDRQPLIEVDVAYTEDTYYRAWRDWNGFVTEHLSGINPK
jgi:hypothetical protein